MRQTKIRGGFVQYERDQDDKRGQQLTRSPRRRNLLFGEQQRSEKRERGHDPQSSQQLKRIPSISRHSEQEQGGQGQGERDAGAPSGAACEPSHACKQTFSQRIQGVDGRPWQHEDARRKKQT